MTLREEDKKKPRKRHTAGTVGDKRGIQDLQIRRISYVTKNRNKNENCIPTTKGKNRYFPMSCYKIHDYC